MNVDSWLKRARTEIDSLDAELILLLVLGEQDRTFLLTHGEMAISGRDMILLDRFLTLRKKGLPLAYISGEKEFYGRKFFVNQHVLIPRPESEAIIDIVKGIKFSKKGGKVLDVGTGSGILAITLKLEMPELTVTASDISRAALFVASRNAVSLNARVDFLKSDLLLDVPKDEKFDLIVANLPYVDVKWPWQSKELAWEPSQALYAGDGGMELMKRLMREAVGRTKYVILECDPCQHDAMIDYSKNLGFKYLETRDFQLLFIFAKR